jgi:chorismate mutase/prephenate dehydratase
MAKAKPPAKPAKAAPRPAHAGSLRTRLERVDRELVKLLNERARLAADLGKAKSSDGQPAYLPSREAEVLDQAVEASRGPLPNRSLRAIFNELLCGTRAIGSEIKVAYLGPAYSYSHLAALHRFGQSVELVPVGSISAVFDEVYRGQTQYGLTPIENSTDGRVADTLDAFTKVPLRICGEVQLPIHHYLLAKCPRAEVEDVYSKPQALSQCRNWLAKHMPTARAVEVTSTSTAAKLAQDKPGAAAIASVQAGVHYGLDVLAEKIEDNPANVTRFAVIGRHSAERTGRDRAAAMFEIEHRPGALADAMGIFKRNRLNLTWIESFPIPEHPGGYLFFVELDGHESDIKVRRAMDALRRKAVRLEILGSFPRGVPVE